MRPIVDSIPAAKEPDEKVFQHGERFLHFCYASEFEDNRRDYLHEERKLYESPEKF